MKEMLWLWFVAEVASLIYLTYCKIKGIKQDVLFIAPMVAAAGISAVTGLAQAGVGYAQKMKAAKLAKSNIRPVLEDDPYVEQAYAITGARAGQGLSDASKQTVTTQMDRTMSSSIDAILKGGGSVNNIADLYDSGQGAFRELALADQEMQNKNIANYIDVGLKQKADQERDQFFLNKMVPYQDKAALAAELSKQGMENIWKGVNTVGGAAMGMANQGTYATKNQNKLPGTGFGDFEPAAVSQDYLRQPKAKPRVVPMIGMGPSAQIDGPALFNAPPTFFRRY